MSSHKNSKAKRPAQSRCRPRFEMLESRCLLAGPEVDVLLGAQSLPVGKAVDFGAAVEDTAARARTFTVYNRGDQPLVLSNVNLPDGFRLKEGLSTTLRARARDTFTVEMITDAVGVKSGDLWFNTNDADEAEYSFAISGEVTKSGTSATVAAAAIRATTSERAIVSKKPLVSSNPDWTWQNPTPPAQQIDQIYFLNSREGWMTAQGRGLLHTTDSGKSWTSVQFGPPMGFLSVCFSDWQHGWAVGSDSNSWGHTTTGIIWSTSDGGKTWQEQYRQAKVFLNRVVFTDNMTGWTLASDRVIATTDGGQTWNRITLPPEFDEANLADLKAFDSQQIWVLGYVEETREGKIFATNIVSRTEDGGRTWSTSSFTEVVGSMSILAVVDKANVWMGGKFGYICRYDLSTNSWKVQEHPFEVKDLVGLQFTSPNEGWALTYNGGVLHTIDGGSHWLVNSAIPRNNLRGLVFTNPANGWLYGTNGAVYRTTDGGLNWQDLRQGSASSLTSVSFPTASRGWAVGSEGTILSTMNSGKTWTEQASPVSTLLNGVHFVNSQLGWAVGEHGTILNTRDGGKHWNVQNSKSAADFTSVHFATSRIGWVVGTEGTILNTQDGGTTWSPQNSNGKWDLTDVRFYDKLHGWATSRVEKANPVVLRTDDGGANWTPVEVELPGAPNLYSTLNSMYFVSPTVGWICGGYSSIQFTAGAILKTTDGGKTWEDYQFNIENGTRHFFKAIWFVDEKRGFALGSLGLYYTTVDGGANWSRQDRPCPGVNVADMVFVGSRVGFMVGSGGAILKTTTAGR